MIRREESLEYHGMPRTGKIELRATKPCHTPRELRLAYLPGAGFACEAIAAEPEASFRYTARGNLVAVVTNGSAVPGLGDVGPRAAKPMQEGFAVLMKRLADLDVFDLELDTVDPDRFVETVRLLEPGFGGIVLKDIRAPEGLLILERLTAALNIPVFHENFQSPAVVATAALTNALDLVEKAIADARIVICGAGTVGIGCARLFRLAGARPENLFVYDVHGLLDASREDLTPSQRAFASAGGERTLAEGLRGADVFVGASVAGVLSPEMIGSMARYPIVFGLATPVPEIGYPEARAARRDAVVATALAQFPNALVDHLSFPYVLRGALDVQATRITDGMLLAAARALTDLAREDVVEEVVRAYGRERLRFGPEYLLPKPIDPRILVRESTAVARQAIVEGVARTQVDPEQYQESLRVRLGTGGELMRRVIVKARQEHPRVVFPEGASETVLRAAAILADEGIARPILLGSEAAIRSLVERLGLEAGGIAVIDPARSPRREAYIDQYFTMRRRHGVMRATAAERLDQPEYFGAMMLRGGDAEMMVSGFAAHYAHSLRVILEVIGTAPGIRRISSHYMVLLPRDVYFIADCAVNIDPDAEDLAEIALLSAAAVRALGLDPRVAMLSFSNFGSVDHALTRKVRRATEIVKQRAPGLPVDGEMQLATALNPDVRHEYFPFCELDQNANVLVFPSLQSGNPAMQILQHMDDAVVVGPVLMGTRLPVHLIQYGSSVEDLVNLTAMGIVQAAARPREGSLAPAMAGV
jgi:malate dehydrogenase (oxaloacetate-decarboxylating)(NADP+)